MAVHIGPALEDRALEIARSVSQGKWESLPQDITKHVWIFQCSVCGDKQAISRVELICRQGLAPADFICACDRQEALEAAGRAYWGEYLDILA